MKLFVFTRVVSFQRYRWSDSIWRIFQEFLCRLVRNSQIQNEFANSHCSKSSFFVQKFNFDFPRKLSFLVGEKLVKMWWFWTFWLLTTLISREKLSKKNSGEKLVKMLGFCQNWIFGQKFDFSNSVNRGDLHCTFSKALQKDVRFSNVWTDVNGPAKFQKCKSDPTDISTDWKEECHLNPNDVQFALPSFVLIT